jgi:uncharacterized membrane protein SirB2
MTSIRSSQVNITPSGVRRLGYVVSIALSAGLLYVVNNLLEWNAAPFITEDYEQILPILNAVLIAIMIVNAIWILYDAAWMRSVGRIILNLTVIGAVALTLKVFPFNFAAYTFNWEALVTFVMVFLILGLVVTTIIEIVKLGGKLANG